MAEKNNVFKQDLKFKGFFNYSELYTFCFNWFKSNRYGLVEESYSEKVSSFGKEIQVKWAAKKKVSDYFKEDIKIEWHILGLSDAEVMVGDKKEKTNKGDLKIKIVADLIRDYEENWDKTPFYKFIRGIYDKYIIRNTNDLYEDRLNDVANAFYGDLKAFLNLEGTS
jgi:hypothetical protein